MVRRRTARFAAAERACDRDKENESPNMAGAGLMTFFAHCLAHPGEVGALAPSSSHLAEALSKPLLDHSQPIHVLEIGAGTGAITRQIVKRLKDRDHLDICEPMSAMADVIERDVLTLPDAEPAVRQGRIRLHRCRLEAMSSPIQYEVVIAGLPFNAFEPELVRQLIEQIRDLSKPGASFSYFEYMAFGALGRTLGMGRTRKRLRAVGAVMRPYIDQYEQERLPVWLNTPPAWARHWKWQA